MVYGRCCFKKLPPGVEQSWRPPHRRLSDRTPGRAIKHNQDQGLEWSTRFPHRTLHLTTSASKAPGDRPVPGHRLVHG